MPKGRPVPPPTPRVTVKEEARQQAYLIEHWESLALLAYDGYRAEGRGAVVIGSDLQKDRSTAHYLSDHDAVKRGIGWPDDKTATMVATYDPEVEVIFILIRPSGGESVHRMGLVGGPTPAELYRGAHGQLPVRSA